jgi:hypothetical protein
MTQITKADTLRHHPQTDDPTWQESYFLGWCDAQSNSGGSHHISLCPHLKRAHVWSWIVVNGVRVSRHQTLKLPLPAANLDNMKLGPLHFVSGATPRQLTLTGQFDTAELQLEFAAFTDPVELDFQSGGIKLGSSHYECMGRIQGSVKVGGRELALSGSGWHDHSWGPRKFSSNPAGRWLFAVFGDDLAFSVFSLAGPSGSNEFGYVLDGGVIHPVSKASFGAGVADDGISPACCDAVIRTRTGRGYRVKGAVTATALTGGAGWLDDSIFFAMDGLTQFECGGRLGEGFIEVSELKAPTPAQRAELGLDEAQ